MQFFYNNLYPQKAQITLYVIYICIGLFVATSLNPTYFYGLFALNPANVTFNNFIVHAFMHGDLLHILFNMYALYMIGSVLELSLGQRRYAILYLMLLVGTALVVTFFGKPGVMYVGASGVIMGLFAYLYSTMRKGTFMSEQIKMLLIINILIGLLPQISLEGHLGGAVIGYIIGKTQILQKNWHFRE